MKSKYIELDFPCYFVFGEHENGSVDIATEQDDTVATVSRAHATKLIKQRSEVVQVLCDMAMAFENAAPEEFRKFWHEKRRDHHR